MYKLSISKELFENILLKNIKVIEKEASKYWKKEFLEPKIIEDNIYYDIKSIDKIVFVNTFGEDKPQIIVECRKIEYLKDKNLFKIYLGKVLEQKNIDLFKDEKDILIKKLLDEKQELIKILEDIKRNSLR
ncbi:hypothetical protein CRU87_02300 [Aliarcobacter trophiarum LMG 25534]|uniref:Uncharacterized protein n=1 Tax=Aliarcobacter trophiarum LMG 25534 TaxID=1032241 RepID=A0AAD0QJJ0_9BACT|nr:hypothetical protein [Aliarcobacter trophiarum]AXK48899.1 hypothetical protein ATR_1035 [Aliarcobacter trophiarum LMG 25534]RXI24926.1 hypothetical protein CRU89_08930 [Aliarcobacter trophiarum]RXJ92632.1 hypothetical protein CRU87_02300 [Aliarcobacter trophiarum LMG 25534]